MKKIKKPIILISLTIIIALFLSIRTTKEISTKSASYAAGDDEVVVTFTGITVNGEAFYEIKCQTQNDPYCKSPGRYIVYDQNNSGVFSVSLPKGATYYVKVVAGSCLEEDEDLGSFTLDENLPGFDANGTTINISHDPTNPGILNAEFPDYYGGGCYLIDSYPYEVVIDISKKWQDGDDYLQERPSSITIVYTERSLSGSEQEKRITLNEANNWQARITTTVYVDEFSDLYDFYFEEILTDDLRDSYICENPNGYLPRCQFRVDLEKVYENNGYEYHYYGSIEINNKHKNANSEIHVKKEWNDNNQSGSRPDSVTVHIKNNLNENIKTVTLNEGNNWEYFENYLISKDKQGNSLTYYVTEDEVTGYDNNIEVDSSYVGHSTNNHGYIITNTPKAETIDVVVEKVWDLRGDDNYQIPSSITINLLVDGSLPQEPKQITLKASDNWQNSFTNLPKYQNGREIVYSIAEQPNDDFISNITKTATGYKITNVLKVDELEKHHITTEVICGEGTITGDEEVYHGYDSTPDKIIATAAENYRIDYIMVNGEKVEIDKELSEYTLEQFKNVTEDKKVSVCFYDYAALSNQHQIEEPKKEEADNPNTKDRIIISSILLLFALITCCLGYRKWKRVI